MVASFTVCKSIKDSEDADYWIQQSQKLYWIVEIPRNCGSHKKEPTISLQFELLSQKFEIIPQNLIYECQKRAFKEPNSDLDINTKFNHWPTAQFIAAFTNVSWNSTMQRKKNAYKIQKHWCQLWVTLI